MSYWRSAVAASVVAASVVAAGLAVSAPSASAEDPSGFSTAEAGVHAGAVQELAAMGVFDGTECAGGGWCWSDAISRETAAVWLVRVLDGGDAEASAGGTRFGDVDAGSAWAGHIERLAHLGVTEGCSQQPLLFCGGDPVKRSQMASFLVRAFDLTPASSADFEDTSGSVHEANIDALFAAGVTVGCSQDPLRFCPSRSTTRAQMASFLNRARKHAATIANSNDNADTTPAGGGAPATTSGGGGGAPATTSGGGSALPSQQQQAQAAATAEGEGPDSVDSWITRTQRGLDGMRVSWSPPSREGSSPVREYRLWWKLHRRHLPWETESTTGWASQPQAVVAAPARSYTIDGLAAAGEYLLKLVAVNDHASGEARIDLFIVRGASVLPGYDWMDVGWPDTPDAASFKVQWKPASQTSWNNAAQATAAAGATSHSVEDLTAGGRYDARVQALDDGGATMWTSEASDTLNSIKPTVHYLHEYYEFIHRTWETPDLFRWRVGTMRLVSEWRQDNTEVYTAREEATVTSRERWPVYSGPVVTNSVWWNRVRSLDSRGRLISVVELSARAVPAREKVAAAVVGAYKDDFPWIGWAWDVKVPLILLSESGTAIAVGASASYISDSAQAQTTSGADWTGLWQARNITVSTARYQNIYLMGHELAHHFTLDHRLAGESPATAAGWLYFHDRVGGRCDTGEVYADALIYVTTRQPEFGPTYDFNYSYLSRCDAFGSDLSESDRAVAVSVGTGRVPQWFYGTYGRGDTDLGRLWSDVRGLPADVRSTVAYSLRNSFGGYCSHAEAIATHDPGRTAYQNPWVDGGCGTRRPRDLSATAGGTGTISVTWTVPYYAAAPAIDAYTVQWKTAGGSYNTTEQALVTDLSDLSHTITGLTTGTQYSIRVAAVNQAAGTTVFTDGDDRARSAETTATAG